MDVSDSMELPYNIVVRHVNDESGDYYFASARRRKKLM